MTAGEQPLGMLVEVPVPSFRVPQAREYFETYLVPPPATVFGMLLSFVGEPWRRTHAGARVATALLSEPRKSLVLRTMRRFESADLADETNAKPDFQELLCDVRLAVWVDSGDSEGDEAHLAPSPLRRRLQQALEHPERVERFGGLSLGESTSLVDVVRGLRAGEKVRGRLLVPDASGRLVLPIWPDHVGSAATRWGRYSLQEFEGQSPPASAFETVAPPVCATVSSKGSGRK